MSNILTVTPSHRHVFAVGLYNRIDPSYCLLSAFKHNLNIRRICLSRIAAYRPRHIQDGLRFGAGIMHIVNLFSSLPSQTYLIYESLPPYRPVFLPKN